MRVPPGENGFLIEDVRVRSGFIRAINGSEQWDLHRASSALAERLVDQGSTEAQLGELAGSSIPREMCEDQVTKLYWRVQHTKALKQLMQHTGVPWQHCQAPSTADHWKARTQLAVLWYSPEPKLLTTASMADLPGTCVLEGGAAEARVQQAHSWAEQLVGGAACHFLAAEKTYQSCDCKLVVVLSDGVSSTAVSGGQLNRSWSVSSPLWWTLS
jgi:hypothetical protein